MYIYQVHIEQLVAHHLASLKAPIVSMSFSTAGCLMPFGNDSGARGEAGLTGQRPQSLRKKCPPWQNYGQRPTANSYLALEWGMSAVTASD